MSSDEEDDKSGSESEENDEDDDDDSSSGSGSGSGSGSDDDDDDDDDGSESNDDDEEKKAKENAAKEGDGFKNILSDMTGVEADIESFFGTLSMDTREAIGFNPNKNRIRGAYVPTPLIPASMHHSQTQFRMNMPPPVAAAAVMSSPIQQYVPVTTSQVFAPNSPQLNQQQSQQMVYMDSSQSSPNLRLSQSQFNSYGMYRHQQQSDTQTRSTVMSKPTTMQPPQIMVVEQPQQSQQQRRQTDQDEDAAGLEQPREKYRLNKESQNVIDDYYKNLQGRKPSGHMSQQQMSNRNLNYSRGGPERNKYSQHEKHKNVYDEDDLKRRSEYSEGFMKQSQDPRFFRGDVTHSSQKQRTSTQNLARNQQKIDQAIKILLGRS